MPSLQGQFLIASPHLCDSNFLRSVVLLVEHGEEGAFGLVLNRPLDRTVREIWELLEEEPCSCELPIYLGGPVAEGALSALHTDENLADEEVMPGVYFSVGKERLDDLVHEPPWGLRVFNGYSGWGESQLEGELEVGGWLTVPATVDDVFGDVDEVWARISRRINLEILAGSIDPERVPDDPSWN
jgi:putative transcriptional regulator